MELMFQKKLTLIKKAHQKSAIFVIIGILKMLSHAVSMMAYELKNIAILNAKGVDYRCILWGISKNDAINRLNDSVLEDKGVL